MELIGFRLFRPERQSGITAVPELEEDPESTTSGSSLPKNLETLSNKLKPIPGSASMTGGKTAGSGSQTGFGSSGSGSGS